VFRPLAIHGLVFNFTFFVFNPRDLYYRGYKKNNNNTVPNAKLLGDGFPECSHFQWFGGLVR